MVTGPPGAGKTTVLTALVDALSDADIPHAAIDVEALVWAHPPLTDEQWICHVESACALYRQAGHHLLLVAQTLETDDDAEQLFAAGSVRLARQPGPSRAGLRQLALVCTL